MIGKPLGSRPMLCLVCLFAVTGFAVAQEQSSVHHYFSKVPHQHEAEWGYSGPIGPEFWGELDPAYRIAAEGTRQSPINIHTQDARPHNLAPLRFDYQEENVSVFNTGHAIRYDDAPGSYLYLGDEKCSLEQFHVHTPSEHTLDGDHFPAELHFVHRSPTGGTVVVAVFVKGDEKSTLEFPLLNDLPTHADEAVGYTGSRSPAQYLPASKAYFEYLGSFTTPPCHEGVRWIVLEQPIGVHSAVVDRFASIIETNNRPPQNLHGRVVHKSK